jgi:hypothetical protein
VTTNNANSTNIALSDNQTLKSLTLQDIHFLESEEACQAVAAAELQSLYLGSDCIFADKGVALGVESGMDVAQKDLILKLTCFHLTQSHF